MNIQVPTPHNQAKKGEIAKVVLMPGDPLRAKYIVENFFDDYVCYNQVRGMLGYTGHYKGVTISVQGSGMGVPSMAIYSRELFEGYDVDYIIRVGSAGALANSEATLEAKQVKLGDILIAKDVDTDSNYGVANNLEEYYPEASEELLAIAKQVAPHAKVGTIFTSDTFYKEKEALVEVSKTGVLGVEMESYGLYMNSLISHKNALAIFTVSDNPILGDSISSKQRETGFNDMIKIALDIAVNCQKKETM